MQSQHDLAMKTVTMDGSNAEALRAVQEQQRKSMEERFEAEIREVKERHDTRLRHMHEQQDREFQSRQEGACPAS